MSEFKEGNVPPQEHSIEETLNRVRQEKLKLDRYGREGQKVKIIGRSISPEGKLSGEIIRVEITGSFEKDNLSRWRETLPPSLEDLPQSRIEVRIVGGERNGEVVKDLSISEWEPTD